MARRRATLADVAREAGVSTSTASLVLSGRARELRISRDVEERVTAAAAGMGYRRNRVSQGLRTGRTGTIGFVSDTVATSQLAGNMIKGALERARERNLMVLFGETEGDASEEVRILHAMADRQVDGIVLACMYTRVRDVPSVDLHVPAVLLNALPGGRARLPTVMPDELGAGRSAARVLLEAGHRDGIHVIGAGPGVDDVPAGGVAASERLQGITEELAAAGTRLAGGRVYDVWQPPTGLEATRRILAEGRPRALICLNDHLAMGAYQALQEAGLRVPEDVSVVSFDDMALAGWLRPGLTTVALPHYELGSASVDVLCRLMEGEAGDGDATAVHRLDMPLRRRASVAAPSVVPTG